MTSFIIASEISFGHSAERSGLSSGSFSGSGVFGFGGSIFFGSGFF